MRHTLAVATREVAEKKFILVAAAVAALIPFAGPFIPGVQSSSRGDAQLLLASFLSVAFSLALSVMLGATMIGRDLSERRMTFYFSRPLSPAAIWFGKLGASIFVAAISGLLILLPSILVSPRNWSSWGTNAFGVALTLIGATVVYTLLAHTISSMVRSRSPLALADFVLVIPLSAVVWLSVRPIIIEEALALIKIEALFLALLILAALIAAGVYQLAAGRTQVKASHYALSRALWSIIGAGIVLLLAFNVWVTHASPAALAQPQLTTLHGDWAIVWGKAPSRLDYPPAFLINGKTSHWERIHPVSHWVNFTSSADGRHAFWFERTDLRSGDLRLAHAKLGEHAEIEETNITVKFPRRLTASADGSRIVAVSGIFPTILTVYDIGSGRSLGSINLPKDLSFMDIRLSFVTPDVVRFVSSLPGMRNPEAVSIHEWTLSARRLTRTGTIGEGAEDTRSWPLPDGTLFVLLRQTAEGPRRGLIVDGRTGAVLRELPPDEAYFAALTRLPDGRYATIASTNHRSAIRIDGLADLDLGGDVIAFFGGEIAPGKLVVSAVPRLAAASRADQWQTLIVDTASGRIVKRFDDLRAASSAGSFTYMLGTQDAAPSPSLFLEKEKGVVMLDPATWERKKIL
jgi:hypothetical protein